MTARDILILVAVAFILSAMLFYGLDYQAQIEQAADIKRFSKGGEN